MSDSLELKAYHETFDVLYMAVSSINPNCKVCKVKSNGRQQQWNTVAHQPRAVRLEKMHSTKPLIFHIQAAFQIEWKGVLDRGRREEREDTKREGLG